MKHLYLKNVTTLSFNAEKCIGCERCTEICPREVFAVDRETVRVANRDMCIECGACALNCPVKAISVDAGVGCAAAIIKSWFTGKEPFCDCGDSRCC